MASSTPGIAPELRRARGAVAAMFLTNGALLANLLPRYPEIEAALGLDNATYGLVLACFPAGAIVAGLGAGAAIRRLGSARASVIGTALTVLGLLLAARAPVAGVLALALLLAGACDAITDVAQNAHGLRVQRRYGRSIINSFHALWSVGAVTGGVMAAAAIALEVPLRWHLTASGLLFTVVALVALRSALPGRDGDDAAPERTEHAPADGSRATRRILGVAVRRPAIILGALVVIALGGTLVENSGNSWATLYLSATSVPPPPSPPPASSPWWVHSSSAACWPTGWSTASASAPSPARGARSSPPGWDWPWRCRPCPAPSPASPWPASAPRAWCLPRCRRPTTCPACPPGPA